MILDDLDARWFKHAVNWRYRADPAPFEWLESFVELESLIKEAQTKLPGFEVVKVVETKMFRSWVMIKKMV